jgi:hypothetical protein
VRKEREARHNCITKRSVILLINKYYWGYQIRERMRMMEQIARGEVLRGFGGAAVWERQLGRLDRKVRIILNCIFSE